MQKSVVRSATKLNLKEGKCIAVYNGNERCIFDIILMHTGIVGAIKVV